MKIKKVLAMCLISAMVLGALRRVRQGRGRKHSQRESGGSCMEGSHDHALWEISGNSELHPGEGGNEF